MTNSLSTVERRNEKKLLGQKKLFLNIKKGPTITGTQETVAEYRKRGEQLLEQKKPLRNI